MKFKFLLAFTALVLGACTGENHDAVSSQGISSAKTSLFGFPSGGIFQKTDGIPDKENIVIEYYGDSTIYGYKTRGVRVKVPAPAAMEKALSTNPIKYTVINEGVNASDSCELLNGRDKVHPKWRTQMANSKADYVIINFAINDRRNYSIDLYKKCMTSLARIAKQSGKTVLFETPNPTRYDMAAIVTAMKEVANENRIPVIDQYTHLMTYLNGRSVRALIPDGIHPSQETYILKGQFAASYFEKR